MPDAPPTPYESMGGAPFFATLVRRFYAGVADDPVLRPLYPDDELEEAERRLRMFLEQYWGGPTTYHEERGHPRLRMRHAPFTIDERAHDHWLQHMREAVDTAKAEHGLDPAWEQQLWSYFVGAALAMVNTAPEDLVVPSPQATSDPLAPTPPRPAVAPDEHRDTTEEPRP